MKYAIQKIDGKWWTGKIWSNVENERKLWDSLDDMINDPIWEALNDDENVIFPIPETIEEENMCPLQQFMVENKGPYLH